MMGCLKRIGIVSLIRRMESDNGSDINFVEDNEFSNALEVLCRDGIPESFFVVGG